MVTVRRAAGANGGQGPGGAPPHPPLGRGPPGPPPRPARAPPRGGPAPPPLPRGGRRLSGGGRLGRGGAGPTAVAVGRAGGRGTRPEGEVPDRREQHDDGDDAEDCPHAGPAIVVDDDGVALAIVHGWSPVRVPVD